MMLLDDIFVGTNKIRPSQSKKKLAAANPVVGFNVYRNGRRQTSGNRILRSFS
jgi:hypothetical protein